MIDAVFFDLFETLVTSFDPDRWPGPSVSDRLGVDAEAFDAQWRAVRPARYTGVLPDYRDALRAVCRALRHAPDEGVIERLFEERQAFFAAAIARTSDEVVALLTHLSRLPIRVGVISNSVPEFVDGWSLSPIRRFVDDIVFSHEVGHAKPQAEIYALACYRGGVRPQHAVFVGDGDSDELRGAEDAGLRPFWATWFLDRWPPGARGEPLHTEAAKYPRLRAPAGVLSVLRDPTP